MTKIKYLQLIEPLIFKEIQESKANIIGLQEVTSPFLKILLNEKWLQDEFYISDINIPNYGQIILSRYPFQKIEKYCFSSQKMVITVLSTSQRNRSYSYDTFDK